MADLLKVEPELARKLGQLTSIPGIGLTTAIVVVAETNGFILVENERQLAFYAGLDVVQHQSGFSARATRISRRGKVRLRRPFTYRLSAAYATTRSKSLFMPACALASPAASPA